MKLFILLILISSCVELTFAYDYIIQWTTQNSNNQRLDLIRKFSNNAECKGGICDCEWWKIAQNTKIFERGEDYILGTSSTECRLVIPEFDFEKDLDVYEPINRKNRSINNINDPTFVIGYFESLWMSKNFTDENITEYTCFSKIHIPNIYNSEIEEGIFKSLGESVSIIGQILNTKYSESLNDNSNIKRSRNKRNIGSNQLTISQKYRVNKSVANYKNPIFECKIQLYENKQTKKIYYEEKIYLNIELKNYANRFEKKTSHFSLFHLTFYSLLIFYSNLI